MHRSILPALGAGARGSNAGCHDHDKTFSEDTPMKTLHHLLVCAALLAPLSFTAGASAQPAVGAGPAAQASPDATATAGDLTDGEVRKVDREAGTITLKHGDIRNLDMPGMTMVFKVGDPALLDKVKAGDKVRFRAEKVSGAIAVTRIDKAQ